MTDKSKAYTDKITWYQEQIENLQESLSRYKTAYLDNLYKEYSKPEPEQVAQDWLTEIWEYCQSGGTGHSLRIHKFDHDMKPSAMVQRALKNVHYIGCECYIHSWPACWNVKPEYYNNVKDSCTSDVTNAFYALGYTIYISKHKDTYDWTD